MDEKILENDTIHSIENIENIINYIKGKNFSGEVIYNNEKFIFVNGKAIRHKEFVLQRLSGL